MPTLYNNLEISSIFERTVSIDISKFREVMRETKGYYELKANVIEDHSKERTYILRLNAESFRNYSEGGGENLKKTKQWEEDNH
jgi:hypothetical protein